jgi:hypothetical protein
MLIGYADRVRWSGTLYLIWYADLVRFIDVVRSFGSNISAQLNLASAENAVQVSTMALAGCCGSSMLLWLAGSSMMVP